MTRFIIIVDVFRVFVDTGEIKYIPFSEEALQCLYVGRAYVDLQVVGTDNDFHIGIMLPAYLSFSLLKRKLSFNTFVIASTRLGELTRPIISR